MINLKKILKKTSLTYGLTGVSPREFKTLTQKFDRIIASKKDGHPEAEKELETAAEKLFFVLFYYTVHPTYSMIRAIFGYGPQSAKTKIRQMTPDVEVVLHKHLHPTKHRVSTFKKLYSEFAVPKNVFTLGIPKWWKKKADEEPAELRGEQEFLPPPIPSAPAPAAPAIIAAPAKNPTKLLSPPEPVHHEAPPLPPKGDAVEKPAEVSRTEENTATSKEPLANKKGFSAFHAAKIIETEKEGEREARIRELVNKEIASQMEDAKAALAEKAENAKNIVPSKPLPGTQITRPVSPTLPAQPTAAPLKPLSYEHETKEPPQTPARSAEEFKTPEQPKEETKQPEWIARLEHKMAKTKAAPDEIIGKREAEVPMPEMEIKELDKNVSAKLAQLKNTLNEQLKRPSDELSIIELVDAILQEGFYARASDIHIEPEEKDTIVRLRIDGVLHDIVIYPKIIHSAVITRIKVIAGLRTDEHQAAQDGRFKTAIPDVGYVDVRVSIAPTYYGENSVMRVLTQQKELSLEEIGLVGQEFDKVTRAIERPYGMILACGPTGSGKTSSLYAILKMLNTRDVSIITIEDPIEYSMKGVDQIQVNAKTGLTFANGLRALLRQDPDILMVGEIRDEETARIAVNAALTGHLLLSTIHTNDAATALPRLVDMGVEPFLVSSTVNLVIGQRLIRRICQNCKEPYTLDLGNLKELSATVNIEVLKGNTHFYRGKGCDVCDNSGYKGRVGIFEVLEMAENIKALIMSRASSDDIKYVAVKNGMTTMLEDGIKKAAAGITTIEEVLRVAQE